MHYILIRTLFTEYIGKEGTFISFGQIPRLLILIQSVPSNFFFSLHHIIGPSGILLISNSQEGYASACMTAENYSSSTSHSPWKIPNYNTFREICYNKKQLRNHSLRWNISNIFKQKECTAYGTYYIQKCLQEPGRADQLVYLGSACLGNIL